MQCKGQIGNQKVNKIENDAKHLNINSFTVRTHNCEQLRPHNVEEVVTLCGWLEFRRMGMFIILRDGYGKTQFLIPPEVRNVPLRSCSKQVINLNFRTNYYKTD